MRIWFESEDCVNKVLEFFLACCLTQEGTSEIISCLARLLATYGGVVTSDFRDSEGEKYSGYEGYILSGITRFRLLRSSQKKGKMESWSGEVNVRLSEGEHALNVYLVQLQHLTKVVLFFHSFGSVGPHVLLISEQLIAGILLDTLFSSPF